VSQRVSIRPAGEGDRHAVLALLAGVDLPPDGIPGDLVGFSVAEIPEVGIIGVAGLEHYGRAVLLRSVAVKNGFQTQGVGHQLVTEALQRAEAGGAREVFLLTTNAQDYFTRFGFAVIPRSELPQAVFASAELRGACPDTAHVMRWVSA